MSEYFKINDNLRHNWHDIDLLYNRIFWINNLFNGLNVYISKYISGINKNISIIWIKAIFNLCDEAFNEKCFEFWRLYEIITRKKLLRNILNSEGCNDKIFSIPNRMFSDIIIINDIKSMMKVGYITFNIIIKNEL